MSWWVRLKLRLRLIEDCKAEWRKVSTWITAAAVTLWGMAQAFPSAALAAWNTMPDDIRAHVPHQDLLAFAMIGVLVAKFIRQKKHDGEQA